jgi:hypothetical protein
MTTVLYLAFQALLYAGLAAWCTLAPDRTSRAIGFGLTNGSARSEYLTVYGGLELGMAAFFALTALNPEWRRLGLLFALCTYGCLATFRLGTLLLVPGVGAFPKAMFGVEATMAVLAGLLLLSARSPE